MKKKIFISSFLFCLFTNLSFSQSISPIKKIRAYKQATIPGISQTNFDENGDKIYVPRQLSYNYWIYVEFSKFEKIEIVDLWISGIRFYAKAEIINILPVKKIINTANSGNDTVILIPPTFQNVLLTYPTGLLEKNKTYSSYLKKLIKQSELVIGFYWKGKKYFAHSKLFILLEPDAHL